MENQQKPTKKIAVNYGLIFGFALILISVIVYALGMTYDQDWKVSVLSFLVSAVIIVLGIKKYKEVNGGLLSLGQGLKTGVAIALIGSIILIVYTLIFINFIETDYLDKALEVARQKMLDNPNMSEEQIDQAIAMQKKFSGPWVISAFVIIWYLFTGFVISLIASLVMQKKGGEY